MFLACGDNEYKLGNVTSDSSPRRSISSAILKRLYAEFAGMCVMPDCAYPSKLEDGTPIVEIAHISSPSQPGPRHDPDLPIGESNNLPNLILVCPTHHRMIDASPSEYSAERLGLLRKRHLDRIARILASAGRPSADHASVASKIQQALQLWEQERLNSREEYWQQLFATRPELLAPTVHSRAFALKSKCYVGGKGIDNSEGNVLDFLAQHDGDVALIEIKTPTTPLLGARYRKNVYAPSQQLVGAISQVLHYRMSLLNDLHALRSESPSLQVHDPTVFVVIGDTERENLTGMKRRSFQLFRHTLKGVEILTYDELFNGLANLAALMEPSP